MAARSALIIATSTYADARLPPLAGPRHDAEALQAVLAADDIGGFDVESLLDAPAPTVREALEAFFADRARDDLLLVHASCHGLKDDDGQLFLAATDTRLDRLMSTGIDASWVNRLMDRCRSERIALFLDCCFAGAFSSAMTRRAAGDRAAVQERFTGRGVVVITASDAMQYSFEGGRQVGEPPGPSPFTRSLVDGLQTGEADRDEDGQVSINELFDYLEDRVRAASPAQTPTKSAVNQTGDWVIARSTRVPSVKLLPERVQLLLKSGETIDRLEAILDLEPIRLGADARASAAATAALLALASDDSRRVAQRAAEALGRDAPTMPPSEPSRATARARPAPARPREDPVAVAGTSAHKASAAGTSSVSSLAWDLVRAATRAVMASTIGLALGLALYLLSHREAIDPQQLQNGLLWPTVGVTIFALLVEVARLLLPIGRVGIVTVVAANRWLESAITGFAASLIVVRLNLGNLTGGVGPDLQTLLFGLTMPLVVGFLAGEAIVGSVRPHARPGSASR